MAVSRYLKGGCFDFALALAEAADSEGVDYRFVAIGDPRWPDHVGLLVGDDTYLDVRGAADEAGFRRGVVHGPVAVIGRPEVELHCGLAGVAPPYRGCREIEDARAAVAEAFPDGLACSIPCSPASR